jgi:hypothetical protein
VLISAVLERLKEEDGPSGLVATLRLHGGLARAVVALPAPPGTRRPFGARVTPTSRTNSSRVSTPSSFES